ncbi:MAG: hypothetical protein ACWA47_06375 [Brevirhabdus sp.]
MKLSLMSFTTALALILGPAHAGSPEPKQVLSVNEVWFDNGFGLSNATLTVSGPEGFYTSIHSEKGLPRFNIQTEGAQADGRYVYELTAATEERIKVTGDLNNGRGDAQTDTMAQPFQMTGAFTVRRGVIVVAQSEGAASNDRDSE